MKNGANSNMMTGIEILSQTPGPRLIAARRPDVWPTFNLHFDGRYECHLRCMTRRH